MSGSVVTIEKLLNPKSMALVGVSTKNATFQVGARAVFDHLRLHGYRGRIDIVTREPSTIDGIASVTDLSQLTHAPDCVLISVPAADVHSVVEKGLALGSRAFVVLTGGFSESGAEGAREQARIARLVRAHDAVMLGPNTTGYVNFANRIALSSTSRVSAELAPVGDVGLVVQSGALGSGLLEESVRNGIGLSHLISTGNEAVTSLVDCIDHLIDDPAAKVIALYVESFREADRMIAVSRRAREAGKPIIVYKAGRSDVGRRAAAGHTGALVGTRDAYAAAVRQLGWIDVTAIEDLLPIANYAARCGVARTMAVISISGGYGGCVADALAEGGHVTLPAPSERTVARMRDHVPAFLSASNPIDVGGTPFRTAEGYAECLDALADDPAIDGVVIANTPIVPAWAERVSSAAARTRARTGKPVSVIWPSEIFNGEALAALRADKVPVFGRVDSFATAVAGVATASESRAVPSRLLREGREAGWGTAGSRAEEAGRALDESRSKALLKALGVRFPTERFVEGRDVEAVLRVAADVGYPVTLKGIAAGVVHKSEFGLVAVGVPDADGLRAHVAAMAESADGHGLDFQGFLLGETVRPGAEVIVGLGLDSEFGPMLTFGAGGILTEIMRDAAVRLLPMDTGELRAMIETCRIGQVLHGARGKAALDIDALVAFLETLAGLAPRLGRDFAGVEINPVGVGAAGEGVWALDATVFAYGEGT